jgi:hypothetical protein
MTKLTTLLRSFTRASHVDRRKLKRFMNVSVKYDRSLGMHIPRRQLGRRDRFTRALTA